MKTDSLNSPVEVKINLFRRLTHKIRIIPDFLIIGGQKCGTTSLYYYLIEHPNIAPAVRKQMHFFDNRFKKGFGWYKSNFPTIFSKWYKTFLHKQKFVSGEATPYYLFHPLAASRVHQFLPDVKLIVLLRNPVNRAYSHYNH